MKANTVVFKIVVTLSVICVLSSTPVLSQTVKPIGKHLKDALALNKKRAPLYAQTTNNESLKLSYELMAMESLALVWLSHLDHKAQVYLEAGIGVFDDDLVDMRETPPFLDHFEDNIAPTERKSLKVKALSKNWLKKIKDDNLQDIYHEAVSLLNEGVLKESNQNCLTKHFVESIAMSIKNHEGHRVKAESAGLPDPKGILLSFLKSQIWSISWAQSLDEKAFEVQKNNVPLFCRDVPLIPYE